MNCLRTGAFLLILLFTILILPARCGAEAALVFPDELLVIGDEAFYGDTSVHKVVIPEGTRQIGRMAFANSSITEISLPESLDSIADDAFFGCNELKTVNISGNLISRMDLEKLFSGTPWLIASGDYSENIAWHFVNDGTLLIVGNGILSGYTQPWQQYSEQIISVRIGEGITMLDGPAFSGCSALTSCILPEGLIALRDETFRDCQRLTGITIPSSVETIGSYAFYGCSSLKDLTLGSGLLHIADNAFGHNISLEKVMLPKSIKTIDESAFYAASSLAYIDIMSGNTIFTAQDGTLYSADKKTLLLCPRAYNGVFEIPAGVVEIAPCAFQTSAITDIVFPDSVEIIGKCAFSYCRNLTSVTLGSNVAVLREMAFETCTEMRSIYLPAALHTIESNVFNDCVSLSSIHVAEGNQQFYSAEGILFADNATTLVFCPPQYTGRFTCPDSVLRIADGAFMACTAITEITLPDGLKTIGKGAFNRCSVTTVNIPDGVEQLGDYAFSDCRITNIRIPSSITEMGSFVFFNCSELNTIILEDGLETIGYGAFSACTALKEIEIPASISSIGLFAFEKCSELTTISVSPDNPDYFSTDGVLFGTAGAGSLIHYPAGRSAATYEIPTGISRLTSYAIMNCDALACLVIPAAVTTICTEAFSGCENLECIEYLGTEAQWDAITWDYSGNWIAGYDPQQFIDYAASLVVFR